MRELQVKRLEAVIRAKEARLQGRQALGAAWAGGGRGGRPEAVRITLYRIPPNDVPPPVRPSVFRASSEINIQYGTRYRTVSLYSYMATALRTRTRCTVLTTTTS